jgi:glycosyltransferase involved in cell wall biosynthesis
MVPAISVVIPCYQAADTVGEAVGSALAQTSPAHEVIVCDDGSTDDVAAALAQHADRIKLLRKDNGGGASALNRAVAVATGELVAILDADDLYAPGRLEAIGTAAALRPDLDILATDAWLEREGAIVGRYSEVNPFMVDDQRAAILRTCFPGGWPAVRRRRLLDAGGFDESFAIAYDWECWIRLIHGGAVAGMVDEPLLTYRIRTGSLSADTIASLRERIRMLERSGRSPALLPHERAVLEAAVAGNRRRLAGEEIGHALTSGAARRKLLQLALRRRVPLRSRFAALRVLPQPRKARTVTSSGKNG